MGRPPQFAEISVFVRSAPRPVRGAGSPSSAAGNFFFYCSFPRMDGESTSVFTYFYSLTHAEYCRIRQYKHANSIWQVPIVLMITTEYLLVIHSRARTGCELLQMRARLLRRLPSPSVAAPRVATQL